MNKIIAQTVKVQYRCFAINVSFEIINASTLKHASTMFFPYSESLQKAYCTNLIQLQFYV